MSPRRKIITLKLPKVQLNPRDTYFLNFPKSLQAEKPESGRYVSMSVECAKSPSPDISKESPLRSNCNSFQSNIEDYRRTPHKNKDMAIWKIKATEKVRLQKISNMPRDVWKNSRKNFADGEISIRGEGKTPKLSCSNSPSGKINMYQETKIFKEGVDAKYKYLYDEIDLHHNGYFILDDIINMLILTGLQSNHNDQSYLALRGKALDIFQTFFLVSMKSRINRKDFFGVCAVYEHNFPESSLSGFFISETLQKLRNSIGELRQVFTCYSKDKFIDYKELKSIMACVNVDEFGLINNMISVEPINFARFLRFLPLFLWMHTEVIKQIDENKSKL
ncbi:hypothetical protein SteCoe_22222 [Stentor coeruleus]|uniref:Uncharacterized protein n=1 Tax=Stentor coeruleus TaxID=5963 RepID=A0A1R2BMT4_9CILI|nr:hypothetical protein SteCoe_22222 [Stentor coeruleus]